MKTFSKRAYGFIVEFLSKTDEASGEVITDAARKAGIRPKDDRAFGPIYMSLAKKNIIEKCGTCLREKGHNTSGGTVWRLKRTISEPQTTDQIHVHEEVTQATETGKVAIFA
jgi:hypothetical protein